MVSRRTDRRRRSLSLRALLAAVVLGQPALAADVPTLGWAGLRPNDPSCAASYAFSRSQEACTTAERDMDFLRCGSRTTAVPDGEVRIAGYAHPLTFEFEGVTAFYLTPPMLRCKHAPPPMPNQIIYVESEVPVDIGFDPVFVTGRLVPALRLDGLNQIRYRMEATGIAPAFIPDVQE